MSLLFSIKNQNTLRSSRIFFIILHFILEGSSEKLLCYEEVLDERFLSKRIVYHRFHFIVATLFLKFQAESSGIDAQPTYNQPEPPAQPSYNPPAQPSYNPPAQPSYNPPAQPSYNPPAQPSYNPPAAASKPSVTGSATPGSGELVSKPGPKSPWHFLLRG